MANTNTLVTGTLQLKSQLPANLCVSKTLLEQIVSALQVSVSVVQDSSITYSPSAPTDKTKLWQQIDAATGIPIGSVQRWDSTTSSWIPTSGETVETPTEEPICISDSPDNALEEDSAGCLTLPASKIPCRSGDSDNLIQLDASNCWKVARGSINEADISSDPCNAVKEGSDDDLFVRYRGLYLPPANVVITNQFTAGDTNYSLSALGAPIPDWDPGNPSISCFSHVYLSWECWFDPGAVRNGTLALPMLRVGINGRTYINLINIGDETGFLVWFFVPVTALNVDQLTVNMFSDHGSPEDFFDGSDGQGILRLEGYLAGGNVALP